MTHSIFNAYADNAIQHGSVASPHVGIATFHGAPLQPLLMQRNGAPPHLQVCGMSLALKQC